MPITSSQASTTPQADGSLNVQITLFDQDGTAYPYSFPAPAGFNVAARVASLIAELDEQLAAAEFETLLGL